MSEFKGQRELSYYRCLMGWTGKRITYNPAEVQKGLAMIRDVGIRWIGADGINLMEPTDYDCRTAVRQINTWLQEDGLRMSSFHYAGPTYAPLNGSQDKARQIMRETLEVFGVWRPKAFVIHPCWILGDNTPKDVERGFNEEIARHGGDAFVRTIAANLKDMAHAAAALDIRLALENAGPFLGGPLKGLPQLVAAIDEPNVGYCLDAGHAHLAGESVTDWLRLAGKRLFETHFHDNRGCGLDEHMPAGFGTISWLDVINTLDEIGFPGPVTFETTGWPIEDVAQGYREAIAWWRTAESLAAKLKLKSATAKK
jgi:sugar phosphate isomerase/epimerase